LKTPCYIVKVDPTNKFRVNLNAVYVQFSLTLEVSTYITQL